MVDLILLLELAAFIPILFYIVINHFGGWPLAWYRFRGIPRFGHIIFGSDRKPRSHYHKQEEVEEEEKIPMFDCNGKKWGFGAEASQILTTIGDPLLYHNFDDMNPIRMLDFNKGGEIDGKLIMEAWKNNAIERMHTVGQKAPIPWFLILTVGAVGVAMIAVNIYFTHDLSCVVRSKLC